MKKVLFVLFVPWLLATAQHEEGRIMRPQDGAALPEGEISILATAPRGRLELDGEAITAEEPFPDVFRATTVATPGEHTLALVWETGRKEIRFFVGDTPPAEFAVYVQHPPLAVDCTQCHGLSRRGRFRFQGGCFDCHPEVLFAATHQHESHVLQECGQCHNAHGSTTKSHLLLPRETACKLCHT